MSVSAQADRVGTTRGPGRSGIAWAVVAVIVVAVVTAGILMALRREPATPSTTQRAPAVVAPVEQGSAKPATRGYEVDGWVCHQCR